MEFDQIPSNVWQWFIGFLVFAVLSLRMTIHNRTIMAPMQKAILGVFVSVALGMGLLSVPFFFFDTLDDLNHLFYLGDAFITVGLFVSAIALYYMVIQQRGIPWWVIIVPHGIIALLAMTKGRAPLLESLTIVDNELLFDIGQFGNITYGILFWAQIPLGIYFIASIKRMVIARSKIQALLIGTLVFYIGVSNMIRYIAFNNSPESTEFISILNLIVYGGVLLVSLYSFLLPKDTIR